MDRRTKFLTYLTAALAPCLIAAASPAFAQALFENRDNFDETFAPTAAVIIPGLPMNSWDISFVDPVLGKYYLGDRTNNAVDVVDTATNTFAGFIGKGLFTGPTPCPPAHPGGANDCSGPDGVMTVNSAQLWVGDGDSSVKVFNLTVPSSPLIATISTGGDHRADELCFAPGFNLVLVANNAEDPFPFATLISSTTLTVLTRITFDGTKGAPKATNGAEQCVWSAQTQRFYLAIPEINGAGDNSSPGGVAVITPGGVVETFFTVPRTSCVGPQGMALGPGFQALLGCNGQNPAAGNPTAIIDIRNGAVLATMQNQSGSDEVWYNPGSGTYALARSSAAGGTQLLGIIDAQGPIADQSIAIAPIATGVPNSHSVAADPVHNQIYLPIGKGAGTICGTTIGGSPGQVAAVNAEGCIAVFTATPGGNDQCLAVGAPVISVDAFAGTRFLTGPC
jgi:hypothetical protein